MQDDDRRESMWYCPKCRAWVGWKLDKCVRESHERPRYPLYYDDAGVDHARDVRLEDRIQAKLRGFVRDSVQERRRAVDRTADRLETAAEWLNQPANPWARDAAFGPLLTRWVYLFALILGIVAVVGLWRVV